MRKATRYRRAWERLLGGEVLILDGGVSTELERTGVPMDAEAWSARANLDSFEDVVDVHRAFIDAGAGVITANTYAASRLVLEPAGLGDRVEEVNRRAIEAAITARDRAGAPDVLIAGSLSHMVPIPEGAYRVSGKHTPTRAAMDDAFGELASIHAEAGVDLELLEMMSIADRMAPVFDAIAETNLAVWCGLSAARSDDGSLVSWHEPTVPFEEVVDLAAHRGFDVIGVMHSRPEVIADALAVVAGAHDGPTMAYPDSGHLEMPHWRFVDVIAPADLAAFAAGWRDAGVGIIGGCCGLGTDHIRALVAGSGS